MFNLGLDIGYSNLKIAFGEDGEPETVILPAGAAPTERLPGSLRPGAKAEGYRVQLDGKSWATGIHPSRFEVWERSLHPDYASTPAYRALFHTALAISGRDVIDLLVTGLPSAQFEERRKSLEDSLRGRHQVAAKRSVEVREVQVVPQPVGGFMAAMAQAKGEEADLLAEGRVLVLDPGHFSFDWVLICNSELQKRSSGSSTEAMSAVLEDAAVRIGEDFGGKLEAERIEQALQEGKGYVRLFGNKVEITPYLDQAAREIIPVAAERMRASLRKLGGDIDALILVGGGAKWWLPAAGELFPKARAIVPENPLLANALGFFELGGASG